MKISLLDPAVAERLLERHKDLLAPQAEAEERYLSGLRCPKCRGSTIRKEIDKQRPFLPSEPLPQWNGRCADCECLFSSRTGIIIEG